MDQQDRTVDRDARLAEIRRQIVDGSYETPQKLAAAVDALHERLLPVDRHAGLRRSPRIES